MTENAARRLLRSGYWLLPGVGIRWSLILLALPLLAICLALDPKKCNRALLAASAFVLLVATAFSRAYDDASLFPEPRQVRRDNVASVIAQGSGMKKVLLVNAVPITALTSITKVMAHLPMALDGHPAQAWDWDVQRQIELALLKQDFPSYFAWHYPPPFLFVASLLARLPYAVAFMGWVFVSLIPYLVVMRAIVLVTYCAVWFVAQV